MIVIDHVDKSYKNGQVKAVNDLSLTVQQGEIFGFLGPNGAGKSTTINMLTGLLQQDRGSIKVHEFDTVKDNLKVKQLIGYVPDEPLFYEKMTGLRYLNFIADVFELDEKNRKNRIAKLSEEYLMQNSLEDVISSYSHGMKQKLQIMAALIHDPEVFILDEPMVGLDPKSSYVLKETMRTLCDAGKTVFFSTHVMEVAERLCDRVGIIQNGSLIACAPFEELKKASGETNSTLEQIFLELTNETHTADH